MKKLKKFAPWIVPAIVCVLLSMSQYAISRLTSAGTFKDHVAQNDCIDWGSQDLTNTATSTVTTACGIVESCVIVTETNAATAKAAQIVCQVPTQTVAADKGTVDMVAENSTGTTTVNYIVTGYGQRGER